MEIKINTTVNLPNNVVRREVDRIVQHIQEVLVHVELGIIPKDDDSIRNAILGPKKEGGCCYEFEEAYLNYIPYMFWFYHLDGKTWTIQELEELWTWEW